MTSENLILPFPVTTTGGHLEAHPGPRRMSMVDGCSVGILKAGSPLGGIGGGGGLHREGSTARLRAMLPNHLKLSGSRKTVSFCQRDNVTVSPKYLSNNHLIYWSWRPTIRSWVQRHCLYLNEIFLIDPKFETSNHIGTECPLSGLKFSSTETGMGVTYRP